MTKELGTQFAALPFQIAPDGLRVLLLTSRETRRWIIPKGWPIRGMKPREVAAREAFEEAGLVGRVAGKRSIGSYNYSSGSTSTGNCSAASKSFFWRLSTRSV